MARIRVVTDSACDLTAELARQHDVTVVPLSIRFGTEEYVDGSTLSTDDFWARCKVSPVLPDRGTLFGRLPRGLPRCCPAGLRRCALPQPLGRGLGHPPGGDRSKIIGVGDFVDLQPEDPWEVTGYVHNVVFTCGAVAEADGTVKIYWGGADTVMCAGEANISDLVALCLDQAGRPNEYPVMQEAIPSTAVFCSAPIAQASSSEVQFPFAILLASEFLPHRGDAALEILALRQQVAVLKRKRPRPPLYPGGPMSC